MYLVSTGACAITNTKNTIKIKRVNLTNLSLILKCLYFSVFELKVYSFIYWFWLILRYNEANAHCE